LNEILHQIARKQIYGLIEQPRDVLFGKDGLVADFVRKLVPNLINTQWEMYATLGVLHDNELVGGVVYHNFNQLAGDIEITAAFSTPRWLTRNVMRHVLGYPMYQLNLNRCTARTARSNHSARDFLERLGFKVEGVQRRAHDGAEDAMLYGVLRSELKWKF
jgi:RimJ/RimL family protein N-acetyltransferase